MRILKVLACLCAAFLLVAFITGPFGGRHSTLVRASVSRAQSEQRKIAIALESYRIEQGAYPPAQPHEIFPVASLTTPIAYLDSHIGAVDPFKTSRFIQLGRFIFNSLTWSILMLLAILCISVELVDRKFRKMEFKSWLRQSFRLFLFAASIVFATFTILFDTASGDMIRLSAKPAGLGLKYMNYATDGRQWWIVQSNGPTPSATSRQFNQL